MFLHFPTKTYYTIKITWSFGQGHLVIFDFGNAVICSLYINIIIFIYSADFDIVCFQF